MRDRTAVEWATLAVEVVAIGVVAYQLYETMPPVIKMQVRAAFGMATAPIQAAAANRKAHAEMMSDVIDLATFGVPSQWVRAS